MHTQTLTHTRTHTHTHTHTHPCTLVILYQFAETKTETFFRFPPVLLFPDPVTPLDTAAVEGGSIQQHPLSCIITAPLLLPANLIAQEMPSQVPQKKGCRITLPPASNTSLLLHAHWMYPKSHPHSLAPVRLYCTVYWTTSSVVQWISSGAVITVAACLCVLELIQYNAIQSVRGCSWALSAVVLSIDLDSEPSLQMVTNSQHSYHVAYTFPEHQPTEKYFNGHIVWFVISRALQQISTFSSTLFKMSSVHYNSKISKLASYLNYIISASTLHFQTEQSN